ncbi:MAG: glycosyl transferase group 1 [Firmicutes bacterium]|nr:glycosyl transferase group 1 [Bacillota bacterium]
MIQHIRVGIPLIKRQGFFDGILYTETLIKSITCFPKHERPQLFLIVTDETLAEFSLHLSFIMLFDGIIFVGPNITEANIIIGLPFIHCSSQDELFSKIDLYFPVIADVLPGRGAVSWIGELKHRYLPELFSLREHAMRNEICGKIAKQACLIVFSSSKDEKEFLKLYPSCKALTRVWSIGIYPEDEWYAGDPCETQNRYGLPDRFILCSNDFCWHKNHITLFKAIAFLRQSGQEVQLVCTGLTDDQQSDYLQGLKSYIHQMDIADIVHILGEIPRYDRIQLIRRSLFVIQPSFNEWLNITAQECQAMGKSIIRSDVDIHGEQNYGIYSPSINVEELAGKITELISVSKPGPDLEQERVAKNEATALAERFAAEFNNLVENSQFIVDNRDYYEMRKLPSSGTTDVITIATSLAPCKELDIQKKAVSSWLALGFKVVSINVPVEIEILQPSFPNIEFVKATRDARQQFGKPYVYFDDFLAYFSASKSKICGIVNSDIHLLKENFYTFISKAAINSFVYGSRVDIETFNNLQGEVLQDGFDYFFFDKQLVQYYPKSEFCIGLPLWDYWVILIPLFYRIPVKKVETAHAYHIKHQSNWDMISWEHYKVVTLKYIKQLTTNQIFPVDILRLIAKYSAGIAFDDGDKYTDVVTGYQKIMRMIGDETDTRTIDNLMLEIRSCF